MACLNDCSFFDKSKNDYYTTKEMWKNIQHLIPKDKTIYEACLMNSKSNSKQYLKELGYNVVGDQTWNCLQFAPIRYDVIVTNPPFETKIKKAILQHFVTLDKPFIIILNSMNIYTKYFREIFKEQIKDLQVIVPNGKIKFEIFNEETGFMEPCKDPAFYCCYLAFKMKIPNDKVWL